MNISLHWQTSYSYEEPVRMVHTELHVLPANAFGQNVATADLRVEPKAPVGVLADAFGNQVRHVSFIGDIERIQFEAGATVATPAGHHAWRDDLSPLHGFLALQETRRCTFHPAIEALMQEAGASHDALIFALKLMDLIAGRYTYQEDATDVSHTAVDFIELGAGVCQDFTHLMIAALRMKGIPSFYVNGYLAPSEGMEEATASHAWVHAYIDGAWHGFDPANHQRQDERYVIVSVGRDYDDVPPVRGSVRGAAAEDYATIVQVLAEMPQQ